MNFSKFIKFLVLLSICHLGQGQGMFSRPKVYGKYPVNLMEAHLDPPELIQSYGFPTQTHKIISKDGYHLTLHRIPAEGRPIVFFVHQLLGTSKDYLVPLTGSLKDTLPLILAQNKMDVWFFNARGNFYSQGHINKSMKSSEFWDFSMDEQANYDIPAAIDKILSVSGRQSLTYIGWSMGTVLFYKSVAANPRLNANINLFVGFASSSGAIGNSTNVLLQGLMPLLTTLPKYPLFNLFNMATRGSIPKGLGTILRVIHAALCPKLLTLLCDVIIALIVGTSTDFADDALSVMLGRWPSQTSMKTFLHFFQEADRSRSGTLPSKYYDFGSGRNLKMYGVSKPPTYDIKRITVPIVTFSGVTDVLIDLRDSEWTSRETSSKFIRNIILDDDGRWSHLDFVVSRNAPELLFKQVLGFITKFNQ